MTAPFRALSGQTPEDVFSGLPTPCYVLDEGQLRKNGEILAECIQNRFIKTLKNTDREALTLSSAYIMSELEIPAIMVEVGFLSNAEEEALLKDNAYREKIVAAIYGGIVDYYEKKDSEESWFDFIFDRFDKE